MSSPADNRVLSTLSTVVTILLATFSALVVGSLTGPQSLGGPMALGPIFEVTLLLLLYPGARLLTMAAPARRWAVLEGLTGLLIGAAVLSNFATWPPIEDGAWFMLQNAPDDRIPADHVAFAVSLGAALHSLLVAPLRQNPRLPWLYVGLIPVALLLGEVFIRVSTNVIYQWGLPG